jgi:hypothetical protein
MLIFGSLVGVIYSLLFVQGADSDKYLIPGIVAFLWSLSLYSMINIFPNVPEKPSSSMKIFAKIKVRVKRFLFYILGVLFLLASTGALYTGYKLLTIWHSGTNA